MLSQRCSKRLVSTTGAHALWEGDAAGVGAQKAVCVLLELDPGDMLSGRIRGPAGEVETFRGWLDLAGRLERVRPVSTTEAIPGEAEERPHDAGAPGPPLL